MLLTSGWLRLAVGRCPYERVQELGKIVYNYYGYYRLPLALTLARWWALRGVLLSACLQGGALLASPGKTGLLTELRMAGSRSVARFERWPRSAFDIVVGLVIVLLGVRIWYLLQYPLSTDEVGSYDFFVAHGPLTISSYYPIPNNHIFYNLLAWP